MKMALTSKNTTDSFPPPPPPSLLAKSTVKLTTTFLVSLKLSVAMRNMAIIAAVAAIWFSIVGCSSMISPGGAINNLGIEKARELQYYLEGDLRLVLDKQKSNINDTSSRIIAGVAYYTEEQIFIKSGTPGVALKSDIHEDGRVLLTVAFTQDNTKTIDFIQDGIDLKTNSFEIFFEDQSRTIKYGNAYYTLGSKNKSIFETLVSKLPFVKSKSSGEDSVYLVIRESVNVKSSTDGRLGRRVIFDNRETRR
ncbi:MAG: hypothetical protein LBQ93_11675 [Treponema sp.]|jgi:hypothetical protein|nr:hypothetical protein [Treponema sp.]